MIFSTATKEIYWILSMVLKNFDIYIFHLIMKYKKREESRVNYKWYIQHGIKMRKLKINNNKFKLERTLYRKPKYFSNINSLKNINVRIYYHKIIFETFQYPDIILNEYNSSKYSIPTLQEKIETVNKYINDIGIDELLHRIFQYTISHITDRNGNKCIRSIVRKKNDSDDILIQYEYKTISKIGNEYYDPIERLPTLI